MRVLVIGGTRFIGLATVRRLHQLGHEVAVFNRGQTAAELPEGVERLVGEVRRLAAARPAFVSLAPDVVLHNIVLRGAEAAQLVEVFSGIAGRVVLTSSMDVYRAYGRLIGTEPGPPVPVPLGESAPLRERWFPYRAETADPGHRLYDYDKIPAERIVRGVPGLPATILRLPMVYGPGDHQRRLLRLLRPMSDGRPALVLEEGHARWRSSYGFVDNVADGIALACSDRRAAGRTYNLADGDLSVLELAGHVKQAAGWGGELVLVARERLPPSLVQPLDLRQDLVAATGRMHAELGYRVRVPLEEAVRRTVEWELQNPAADPPEGLDYAAEDRVLAGAAADASG